MGSSRILISDEEARRMLEALNLRTIEKSVKKGIRRSASIVRRGVGEELEKDLGGSHGRGWDTSGYRKKFHPLRRDIKLSVYKRGYGANVTLLPMRGKGRRSHVLIYLNQGTKERTKGHYRGRITGRGFFEHGVDRTKDKAVSELEQNVKREIMKVYNKYKG